MVTIITISDYDLKSKKYDMFTLEKNIHHLSQWTLVKYQDLTASFCAKYILDEAYSSCEEDTYICIEDILCFQQHLNRDDIVNAYNKLNNKP